jgi:hypothetical protein
MAIRTPAGLSAAKLADHLQAMPSWCSDLELTPAVYCGLSSTEAEYIAVAEGAKHAQTFD